MIRKGMFLGVLGALALALSLAAARPALAQNTCFTFTFDQTGQTLVNPCNGELVTITSGTKTFTFCFITAKHTSLKVDEHAVGMGDQGNTYVIDSHQPSLEADRNDQGLFEFNSNTQENVISLGSAPNFIMHCDQHTTVTPSGQINVSPPDCTTNCTG